MNRSRVQWVALATAVALSSAALTAVAAPPALATVYTHPACATQVPSSPVGSAGASASAPMLAVGNLATVWDPPDNTYSQAPSTTGYDTGTAANPTRSVVVGFGENADTATAPIEGGRVLSNDGGLTFPAATYQHTDGVGTPGTFAVRLRSGRLVSIDFRPLSSTASTATVATFSSTDNGASWTQGTATYTPPSGANPSSLRTDEQPIELADGTIVDSTYVTGANGLSNSILMQSTDGGATFSRRGVIAAATSAVGYNEAGIAQLANGTLAAIIRTSYPSASQVTNLRWATSPDGVTWSTPTDLLASFNGAAATAMPGINPQLVLMSNGILVMSSGRDNSGNGNNWVGMSTDNGASWTAQLTFRNCPVTVDSNGSIWHGSSGNTGLTSVSSNTMLQAVDNCHAGYCLAGNDSGFTTDNQYRIYRRMIDVLTPDTGKIDLADKLRAGTIAVSGNMTYTSSAHPRTGVAGAFDGSTEYWSSAAAAGDAGSMIISLDKTYEITKVGLSMRNGRPESATVSFSTDGTTWSSPAATATNRTDYAIGYTTLATPQNAKYVKVNVDSTTNCESGLGTSCAFLNELELYSTTDSFENDPLTNRPRGWSDLASCWVSTSNPSDSAHVLYCSDGSDTATATATLISTATTAKTVAFRVKPIGLNGAFLFNLLGRNSAGTQVNAYHLAVFPDGSIRRWNGSAWLTIAAAGTASIGSWSTISISATTGSANLTVNGTTVSALPPTSAAATLVGLGVSSGGGAPNADYFAIDDVTVS